MDEQEKISFNEACMNFQNKQYYETYMIFHDLSLRHEEIDFLYNMSLYYVVNHEYDLAYITVSKAKRLILMKMSRGNTSVPLVTKKALIALEKDSDAYLQPLTLSSGEIGMEMIKERITRLEIDFLLAEEEWKEVLRLATLLEKRQY